MPRRAASLRNKRALPIRCDASCRRAPRGPLPRSTGHLLATTALTGCLILTAGAASAQSLPQGGVVVGGSATITQTSSSQLTINQSTNRAVTNWNSFSIATGNSVTINQPGASSVSVNQVVGASASSIYGSLGSNGQVVVANPNGIWFAPGSHVDVAGLVATTATMSMSSVNGFMSGGKLSFDTPGKPNASVVNDGTITVADAGLVALVAPGVANNGIVEARLGKVQLASGNTYTLDLAGDGLVQLAVSDKVLQQAMGPDGQPLGAAVVNSGRILADGGSVYLTANVAKNVVNNVIDMSGVIEARAATVAGGEIILSSGDGGQVAVSGTLDASGTGAGQTGGTVKVLGQNVALNAGASINVSGNAGGGTTLIGGNFHGAGPEPNAQTAYVDPAATITADAITYGDGGNVAVWSDQATVFNGSITARGGSLAGNGGFIETSGGQLGVGAQASVDLSAPFGAAGTWLLDPHNITIVSGGGALTNPTNWATGGNAADITVDSAAFTNINADVLLQANNNITVTNAITMTNNNRALTLNAGDSIAVNANISTNNGAFTATINDGGATAANRDAGKAAFTMAGGTSISTSGAAINIEACNGNSALCTSGGFGGGGATNIGNITIGSLNTTANGSAGGNVTVTDSIGTLTAGTITASGTGNNKNGGAVTLTAGGAISLGSGGITSLGGSNGTGGTVILTSTGGQISQGTGAISASSLAASAGSTISLQGAVNSVGTVAFSAGGTVQFKSSGDLSIGNVGSLSGITISAAGKYLILNDSTGTVSQTQPVNITASGNLVLQNGANYSLSNGSNVFGTVTGDASVALGTVTLADSANLSVNGDPNGLFVNGINSTGAVTITTPGNLTLAAAPGITAGANQAIVLSAGGVFTNNIGANALNVSGSGRWLVYSNPADPGADGGSGNDTFNGLDSGNTAIWHATYSTLPPASVTQSGNRYLFAYQPTISLTSTDASKIYGQDATAAVGAAYTVTSGLRPGVSGAYLADTTGTAVGSASLSSSGTASTAGVSGSPYTINLNSAAGADGYAIGTLASSGKLYVSPATLTVTANDLTKTYGDTTTFAGSEFSSVGLKNGETIGSVSLASAGAIATAGCGSSPYDITGSNAAGGTFNPVNYAITYANGALTVNAAPLSITANNASKTYGQTVTLSGNEFSASGLKNGETVGSASLSSAGAAGTAGCSGSPYAILVSGAAGGTFNSANYTITYHNGALTVAPAPLTITANNASKTYGQTTTFTGSEFAPSGLQNGETVGSVTPNTAGAAATAGVAGSPYAITASNATGGTFNPGNYSITYANGVLTIAPAPLTVTANNASKTYGQTTTFTGSEFSANGLKNGETVGSVALNSAGAPATAGIAGSPYAVTASNATGGTFNPGNYSITYANGVLTIAPAPLTVTANNASKTYGQTTTFTGSEFTANGLKNGETVGSVNLSSAGTPASAGVAGSPYAVTASNATGGTFNPGNYSITYANGVLTIAPAPLTVTANNAAKTYGQTTTFTGSEFTANGIKNGETVGSATLNTAGAAATAGVAGSPYAITVSNAASGTFNPGNYSITYVNGTLTIAPAPLTVIANNATTTYGRGPSGTEFTASGLQNGETIGTVTMTGAGPTSSVAGSPYTVAPSNASGGTFNAGNYTITYVNGILTIAPAPLIVTANNATKTAGQTTNFTGSEFTASGLKNGETVGSVTLSSAGAPAAATAVGSPYDIIASNATGGTFNPTDYIITYANGVLTVTAAPMAASPNGVRAQVQAQQSGGNGAVPIPAATGILGVGAGALPAAGGPEHGEGGVIVISPSSIERADAMANLFANAYLDGSVPLPEPPVALKANEQGQRCARSPLMPYEECVPVLSR